VNATVTQPQPAAVPGAADAAEDLRTLAWLHAAERDSATWLALHDQGFPRGLSLAVADAAVFQALDEALEALDQQQRLHAQRTDDTLAADYADIYLTHTLQASPCESVWLDEDHLMLQGPSLSVRDLYRRHGLAVQDWRRMPDDHLSHELEFVAHLLDEGDAAAAAAFLDLHLLRWLPEFTARVAQRSRSALYAALAVMTLAACRDLRQRLGGPVHEAPIDSVGKGSCP